MPMRFPVSWPAHCAVHAKNVVELPDRVTFTGGFFRFVSNWNVLLPFTTGEILINTTARRLEYRVSFTQLVGALVVFTVFATAFMLIGRFPMPMIPIFLAVMWLWLGGGNVLIGIVRFESFLRRTVHDAAKVTDG